MLFIVFIRILFCIFSLVFFGLIAHSIIYKNSSRWKGAKVVYVFVFSFFMMIYLAVKETSELIKYHLKNQTYSEVCGVIEGFSFSKNRSSTSRRPSSVDVKSEKGDLSSYSVNHFYSSENFDKYKRGDKICIKYFIQFQHIYFHLPSDREILYITKPNSTVYDNHISLTDEYEEFRDEQP